MPPMWETQSEGPTPLVSPSLLPAIEGIRGDLCLVCTRALAHLLTHEFFTKEHFL